MKHVLAGVVALGLIAAIAIAFFKGPETTITLSGARAELSAQDRDTLHVFVTLQNGALPDTLIGASSDIARAVKLVSRQPTSGLPIPANSTPVLSQDGAYFALVGVEGALEEGQLVPISFEFATSGSLVTRANISAPNDPNAAHREMMASSTMNMKLLDEDQEVPTAELNVVQSPDGTWAVTLDVAHFTFDPDAEEPIHVPGHGHAHLYLNGIKLQRMFGPNASIGALPAGDFVVQVSLNTNDHRPYRNDAGPVEAVANIVVE